MNPNYVVTDRAVIITVFKALYGSMFYIRDKYIKIAKARDIKLVIKTPDGTGSCTAAEWMKGAKKMEKVFLIPDKPMILYGNFVKPFIDARNERKAKEKQEEQNKAEIMGTPNLDLAKRLVADKEKIFGKKK